MLTADIRRAFLDFYVARDHRLWPSASLIPNDPTLLLTVAGMVQFQPFFRGEARPGHPRATSVQKCARTVDVENVGLTARHGTFFEMLGNFSFGDYFKRDAIRWAWELSVEVLGFDPERLWATVFSDDDEAEALWLAETDLPPERVVRRGAEDNFWGPAGAGGPCGPCSEIYYDRGPEYGIEGGPEADENRYLEFYNLVFMQYEADAQGRIVGALPANSVDTGMGLERVAMLLQDVPNIFEIDAMRPMLDQAVNLTGATYGADAERDVSLRVVAEHARSAAFLIADGVLPSNEARGYVLRRLLRRAVRHARTLGGDVPVMPGMMRTVVATLGDTWPELRQQAQLIEGVAAAEEERFAATLRSGLKLLDTALSEAAAGRPEAAADRSKAAGWGQLPALTAFTLHDTYGFPIDLTVEIAAEHGLHLDRDEFSRLMEGQRTRARAGALSGGSGSVGAETYREAAGRVGGTSFIGYTDDTADTRIGAIVVPGTVLEAAEEGEEIEIVLPRTPFYAEGGGQLGDHGTVRTPTGRVEIHDTVAPLEGLIVHRGRVAAGEIRAGQDAVATIDRDRRDSITRGHTATHLLHATLKEVVGDHATQAGSAIDAGRFRFDFPAFSPPSADQIAEVERQVNARIAQGNAVATVETTQTEARAMGATALFGEKYGERVRVVRIGDFSAELCGGTHVGQTGEVGLFSVLSESSIAANVRRIEATTGPDALRYVSGLRLVAEETARLLKASPDELLDRVSALLERVRGLEKELARARQQAVLSSGSALLESAEAVDGSRVVAGTLEGADRDGLKVLAADLRNRLGSGVVVLGTVTSDGSAQIIAMVSPDLSARGVTARELLAPGARVVGGGAGGKGDTAQAGGREGARLAEALEAIRRAARERLAGGG